MGVMFLTCRSHHGRLDDAVEHPRTRRTASIVTRAADDSTGASKDDDDSDDDRRVVVDEYDDDDDWVKKNEDIVRAYPLVVGVTAVIAILVNRAVSGIAAVADASSSQTRADVLALIMAGTLILTVSRGYRSNRRILLGAVAGLRSVRPTSTRP